MPHARAGLRNTKGWRVYLLHYCRKGSLKGEPSQGRDRVRLLSRGRDHAMEQQHSTGQPTASGRPQVMIGLALSHEQFSVPQLVEFGVLAEQAGFAAVWASAPCAS